MPGLTHADQATAPATAFVARMNRQAETLRLALAELQRQHDATSHERRRAQLQAAMAEVERRLADVQAVLTR